jgi:hypothetical protein
MPWSAPRAPSSTTLPRSDSKANLRTQCIVICTTHLEHLPPPCPKPIPWSLSPLTHDSFPTRAGPCLTSSSAMKQTQAPFDAHPNDTPRIGSRDSNHLSYTSSCMSTSLLSCSFPLSCHRPGRQQCVVRFGPADTMNLYALDQG